MWGLFGKKKEPQDRLEQAEKLMNKGMSGLVMKTMVSKGHRDLINQSLDTAKQAQLASSGTVPLSATAIVISVTDTGKLLNFDPIVVLVLNVTENDGSTYQKTLETLVSKIQIPRPGDRVGLGHNPANPAELMYMGLLP